MIADKIWKIENNSHQGERDTRYSENVNVTIHGCLQLLRVIATTADRQPAPRHGSRDTLCPAAGEGRGAGCHVDGDDEGQVTQAEQVPHINVLRVGGLGEGGRGLGVEWEEGQQGGEAHGAPLVEELRGQVQRAVPGAGKRLELTGEAFIAFIIFFAARMAAQGQNRYITTKKPTRCCSSNRKIMCGQRRSIS